MTPKKSYLDPNRPHLWTLLVWLLLCCFTWLCLPHSAPLPEVPTQEEPRK